MDTVLEETKGAPRGLGKGTTNRREELSTAKRRQSRRRAHGDMHGTTWIMYRPPDMRPLAATGSRLAPGAFTPTTPGADAQIELLCLRDRAPLSSIVSAVIEGPTPR